MEYCSNRNVLRVRRKLSRLRLGSRRSSQNKFHVNDSEGTTAVRVHLKPWHDHWARHCVGGGWQNGSAELQPLERPACIAQTGNSAPASHANFKVMPLFDADYLNNKNSAIANRSRFSCARRTQYVDGIYRPKYYTVTLKSRLRITQGQWKWNHWIDHTRLTISRVIWRWILSWP